MLAAENVKTGGTYELRLMSLEHFAQQNGDEADLFGANNPDLYV